MQMHLWRRRVALILILALAVVSTSLHVAQAETNDLNKPENVACRPPAGRTDQVRVEWKDTNNGATDYHIYRSEPGLPDWGDPIATVDDGADGGTWTYVDENADDETVYQYGVTAFTDDEESTIGGNEFCREPTWLGEDDDNFRMFYRLVECPDYDGKQVCTENVTDTNGDNQHVVTLIGNAEAYRDLYLDYGFNDPSAYTDDRPFPLDFFPCNNGCANSEGNQYPPGNFEGDDYDPATGMGSQYEVEVIGHELFHKVEGVHGGGGGDPFYTWLIEGQARAAEDRFCLYNASACAIWDNLPGTAFVSQAKNYLGKPELGLQYTETINGFEGYGYNAALFWAYVMEQLTTLTAEPEAGVDVLLNFWLKNEEHKNNGGLKDGITTLNDALADDDLFDTDRRFRDLFQDFAVANFAKDYINNPPPAGFARYNYQDDEPPGVAWGLVKRTVSTTVEIDDVILGTTTVGAWGARYFQVSPDPAVPALHFEINPLAATPHSLYYHVLMIDNGQIVDMYSDEGPSLDYTVDNSPDYDSVGLVVVGLEQAVNFDYGVNLTDGIYILSPNAQFPEPVGDAANPQKFITWLQVLDTDSQPVAGIDPEDFTVTVSNTVIHPPQLGAEDALINSFYSGGRYTLVLRAPPSPGCTVCPLTVQYAGYSDTEGDALIYGPQPGIDNQIIIDRSFSMDGPKFDAAKGQAKIYVDSYDPGDKIGIVAYNQAPQSYFDLTEWSDDSRDDALEALDNLPDPDGNTAIGAALRESMQLLIDQDSPNPLWNMVLLSDGKDTVEDETDHIGQFISEYNSRKKDAAGLQVPVIDVVAVGDDADGASLQLVSNAAGGEFQFLPEPSEAAAATANALTPNAHSLQLAEIYRVFAEGTLGEQQIYSRQDAITNAQGKTHTVKVDGSAGQAVFTVAYLYGDCPIGIEVTIRRPDNTPVGPPTVHAPRHFLWRVPAPGPGDWKVEVEPIIPGAPAAPDACGPDSVARTDFLVEVALVSDITLDAYLGLLPEERLLGKPMPIFALLSDHQPLAGANVQATVESTGEIVHLYDDGAHNDGLADDGVYAGVILDTFHAGGYPVIVDAIGTSPLNGDYVRRARLSFFLTAGDDGDDDKLPDWWEDEYPCLDPDRRDSTEDADQDGLNNAQEFNRHTNPCDPDTDDGGESDGSEVQHNRNPLFGPDDFMDPPVGVAWPSVDQIVVRVGDAGDTATFTIYRAARADGLFTPVATGITGNSYIDTNVEDGKQYCYRVVTVDQGITSAPSLVTCVIPRQDPYPPHGVVLLPPGLNVGAPVPASVPLLLEAFDDPYTEEHAAFDGELLAHKLQSGVAEMQISSRSDFSDTLWIPYRPEMRWSFAPGPDGLATVFARFKDGAGNISPTAGLTVVVDPALPPIPEVYLPVLHK